ncbi:hypothetical protein M0805_009562 [Coniferiporia weirii]|nr:hypothetical protein M0805_009562 [Coniferiporia weirii]
MNGPATIADTDALYATAASAEIAGDFDRAFGLYLTAAQAYLHHARALPAYSARERGRCEAGAKKCIGRAERIKDARKDALRPPARDPFSTEEQMYVLDKSTRVHGARYPAWVNGSENLFDGEVDALPPLGPALTTKASVWRRPKDLHPSQTITLASSALQPYHIRQNVVTDCSVCSAAAVCLHHHRSFGSKLGLSCIFPQDTDGMPVLAQDGRYALRLFVNGTSRKVLVNDLLPFYADGRPISASVTPDFGGFDLWPGLLEKAYMKLMGGYDFPGSNSSIDVHALTGWIPEHIEIKSPSFVREKVWRRTLKGFQQGTCILTLGTGARDSTLVVPSLDGKRTQLLPTHSYAVLDVCENADGSERWMTILNPWTDGADLGTGADVSGAADDLRALRIRDPADEQFGLGGEGTASLDSGKASLLSVSWDDVCSVFEGIYLNWDPEPFRHQVKFHGSWQQKTEGNAGSPQCVRHHLTLCLPQMSVSDPSKREGRGEQETNELWVLLTRHIVDKQREGEFIAVHAVQLEHEEAERTIGGELNLKGTYTNSTHTLTRLTLTDSSAQIAIVASYDGAHADVCFTVQAFSAYIPLAWDVKPSESMYERIIEGTFSSRNAGGNSTYLTFMNNPQYRLRLHPDRGSYPPLAASSRSSGSRGTNRVAKTTVRLIVEGPRNVPLNVMLLWRTEKESGERVIQLGMGDVLASSGAYSYGVAQTVGSVAPGDYCIIVSAFEPRHRGTFTLRIKSPVRMDVDPIPSEGAGMFCKTVKGSWKPGLDGGGPRFGNYTLNPTFEIFVQTATSLKIRLQLTRPSPSIALNVTLFTAPSASSSSSPSAPSLPLSSSGMSASSSPALGRQVATSGAYVDGSYNPAGAATPQITVAPGRYFAVASTFDPGVHAEFQLLVFAKADVKVTSVR